MSTVRHAHRRRVLYAVEWDYEPLLQGFLRFAQKANWIVDIGSHLVKTVRTFKWDGAILALPSDTKAVMRFVRHTHIPMVDIGNIPADMPFPKVHEDNEAIGRIAAEHLLEKRFTHLAYYCQFPRHQFVVRGKSFAAAAQAAGAEFHFIEGKNQIFRKDPSLYYRQIIRHLHKLAKPVGILAGSDEWAVALVNACMIADIAVPDQIAILGVDNSIPIVTTAHVPVSSVMIDFERQTYEAAGLLERMMDGEPPPTAPVLIPPKGIAVRESTDTLQIPHKGVQSALAFIRDHCREHISVHDIAHAAGISVSTLVANFKSCVHHSVHQHVNVRRLDAACALLRDTSSHMDVIAEQAGFPSTHRMCKVFRGKLGCSPREYRQRNS